MHNQKLNSVPLAGTRPNGFCLSQKPFLPLDALVLPPPPWAAWLPAPTATAAMFCFAKFSICRTSSGGQIGKTPHWAWQVQNGKWRIRRGDMGMGNGGESAGSRTIGEERTANRAY